MRRAVLAVVVLLALAGCSGSPTTAAGGTSSTAALDRSMCQDNSFLAAHPGYCAAPTPASATPTGGPAASPAVFPDGLHAQVARITARANDAQHPSDEHPDFNELVTVTVKLTNAGTGTVALKPAGGGTTQLRLFYGGNRYEAQAWASSGDGTDLPQQLLPGTSASFRNDFTLPSAGLDVLAVGLVMADDRPEYTFGDAQSLLR